MHAARTMLLAWWSARDAGELPRDAVKAAFLHAATLSESQALIVAADHRSAVLAMEQALRAWHGDRTEPPPKG